MAREIRFRAQLNLAISDINEFPPVFEIIQQFCATNKGALDVNFRAAGDTFMCSAVITFVAATTIEANAKRTVVDNELGKSLTLCKVGKFQLQYTIQEREA